MRIMDLRKGLIILVIIGMLSSLGVANLSFAQAVPNPEGTSFSSSNEKVDVLTGFYQAPGPSERALVRAHGGDIYRQFTIVDVIAASMTSQAVEALEKNPTVKYVEPDAPVFALETAEVASVQTVPWGIDRIFGDEEYTFETWDYSNKGSGIAVAVLDTGIEREHDDLNVAGGVNFTRSNRGNYGYDYYDIYGHGTHVAGTVAALDDGIVATPEDVDYVVGVVPEVELYAVKVLDDMGRGTISSIVAGIEWSVDNNMHVLNMSFYSGGYNETLENTCANAYEAGHLLVAAGGNNDEGDDTVIYPAKHESVIAVAASDKDDNRADFSNRGPEIELIAPGKDVWSTSLNNSYHEGSGTSMASPHVAGTAALVWAANPDLLNTEIREILQETAEDLRLDDIQQGAGLVRADLAVAAAVAVEEAEYEVAVVAPEDAEETETGEHTYTYKVGNMGTEDDTYDLAVESDGDNFTAVVEEKIAVEAGKTEEVDVEVEITEDAEGVDSAKITLTATSQGDSEVTDSDSMVVTLIGEPVVSSKEASDVTGNSAVLKGEMTDLGGAESAEAWFEWADNKDLAGAKETERLTLEELGTFEAAVDELDPDTSYYFKALAKNDAGIDEGEIVEFTTQGEEELAEPEIITFEVGTRTAGPWKRADVEWEVYHEYGALNEVKSELLVLGDDGEVVEVLDTEITSVNGESASGEHNLRTRGDADAVRLTVTDAEGQEAIEIKNVAW